MMDDNSKIIVDVTWKSAFSIWSKFLVFQIVFTLIVGAIIYYSFFYESSNTNIQIEIQNQNNYEKCLKEYESHPMKLEICKVHKPL